MNPKFNRHEWLRVILRSGISDGAKLRANSLWSYANEIGYCWPNQQQIEERIGHKNTGRTSQFIKEVKESGFIDMGYRPGSNGYPSANYQLLIPTSVGSNSPSTSLESLKTQEIMNINGELAPTEVGAYKKNGELVPTHEGEYFYQLPPDSEDDYVVNGVDTRPPPEWAVVENDFKSG
jgi:hypothetical protein